MQERTARIRTVLRWKRGMQRAMLFPETSHTKGWGTGAARLACVFALEARHAAPDVVIGQRFHCQRARQHPAAQRAADKLTTAQNSEWDRCDVER